jgi:hypothetical protein
MHTTIGQSENLLRPGDVTSLSTSERKTLHAIFSHPMRHNLEWSDAAALVESIGTVEQKANSAFELKIGAECQTLHKPHTKDLTSPDIIELRHFLTRAGWSPDMPSQASPQIEAPSLLVAIDHHGARVYRIDVASAEVSEHVIAPYDPHHFLHHMRHKDQSRERGQKQAEDATFYARIAEAVATGGRIVLVGHGSGASNAAHHLAEYLRERHSETYARVVVEMTADLSALTDPQLLALGRRALGPAQAERPGGTDTNVSNAPAAT